MYAGRVACCPLVSHGEYTDDTDGRTDGRTPDRYDFRYGRGPHNKEMKSTNIQSYITTQSNVIARSFCSTD